MDERSQRLESQLEAPLLAFALLTIPAIAIESSSLGQPWDTIGLVLNWSIWLAFLGEVVLMLRVMPDRGRWMRDHPLDLAIVIFTPPFLPASLQLARVFRLLRLVRLLKAGTLARRLLSTEGVRDAAVLALISVLGGGAAFAAVENVSAWDGVWWAITTVTTVGYGTPAITTDASRVIAIFIMFMGIGFVAVLTAAAAERFVHARRDEERLIEDRLDEILSRLDSLEVALSDRREAQAGRSLRGDPGPAHET